MNLVSPQEKHPDGKPSGTVAFSLGVILIITNIMLNRLTGFSFYTIILPTALRL